MELFVPGVVRCRRKDLGKWLLPWSLESMLLICIGSYGLFSAVWAEVAGAEGQCCCPQAGCQARLAQEVSVGLSGHALLKLSQPVAEPLALESVRWLLFWGGQDETGCGRVTRRGPWSRTEIYICTDGNSNSQSYSETKKGDFLWALISLHTSGLCTLISSARIALSSSATLMRPKVNPYMASQLLG